MKNIIHYCLLILLISLSVESVSGQTENPGNLVIVGGNLADDNTIVFETFIRYAGGAEKAEIAVIPTAGGTPVQSFVYFRSLMQRYGVSFGRVHLIPIAVVDDDSTTDVDESTWKKNAENKVYADLVRKCTGVWFTGGDQLRTMQALVLHDEKKTSVLESVWQVYKTGGVLGGTSAGAAIMSETMIGGGTSLAALIHGAVNNYSGEDFPAEKGVLVVKGLGFFPFGIVDQHFHARARIGRLAVAMMQSESDSKLAFGIDENTAMVYNGKDKQFTVAGEGGVTVLNSGNASLVKDNQRIGITGMDISYLEDGSGFDLNNATLIPAENMAEINFTDGIPGKFADEHGILSTENPGFRNVITQYLVKSGHGEVLKCITTSNINEAFELDFSKTAGWKAFSTPPGREVRYAISGIRMDILPVNIHYSR